MWFVPNLKKGIMEVEKWSEDIALIIDEALQVTGVTKYQVQRFVNHGSVLLDPAPPLVIGGGQVRARQWDITLLIKRFSFFYNNSWLPALKMYLSWRNNINHSLSDGKRSILSTHMKRWCVPVIYIPQWLQKSFMKNLLRHKKWYFRFIRVSKPTPAYTL